MVSNNDSLDLPIGVTEQKALKQLARIEARALKVQQQAERGFVRANRTAARSFQGMGNSARGSLQNVSYQLQDIFVQISSGQGATRALSQQLPQLLSGFGALGAVFGLAAAAGIPLAAALFDIGGDADSAEDSVKALTEAVKNLEQAQKLASQSPGDLLSQYGGLADEAKQLFEINRQIASIRAQGALDTAARGIAGELGVAGVFGFGPDEVRDLEGTIASLRQELEALNSTPASTLSDEELAAANREIERLEGNLSDLRRVSRNVDDLADTLGISEDAAREVVAQFALIGQAQGPKEQAQAMSDLADFIYGASNNLADAEEEGEALYDQLREAAIKALELARVDMASNVSAAADEASRLANELERARGARLDDITNNPDFFDPRNESGNSGRVIRERGVPKENQPGYTPPRSRSGSGGGGGANQERLRVEREAQRLYEATRTELEKYNAEVIRLNDLHDTGAISTDTFNRAMADAKEKYNDAATAAFDFSAINDGLASGLADIIFEGEALSDVLGNLAKSLASAALEAAALAAFNSLFSAILPGFGSSGTVTANAHGNVFSNGRVVPFASGGVVNSPTYFPMRGGTGLMGEAGPEAILPLQRLPGGDLGVRSVAGNVSVPVSVNVVNNAGAQVDVRQSPDGRTLDIMIDQKVASAMAGPRGQKVMRDTYGVRPSVRGA